MIIKVCGMRDAENIRQVVTLPVDWIGFIFYSGSPRCINLTAEIQIPKIPARRVGVFVNASMEEIEEKIDRYQLDYVQLHGNELPGYCDSLQKKGALLIKAFSVFTERDLEQTIPYEGKVSYFLFDTKCTGYGGSGHSFDWKILSHYKGETPFLLSGGIGPDSVDAIRQMNHPGFAGIDLNSRFETAPGMKDFKQLQQFINQLKNN